MEIKLNKELQKKLDYFLATKDEKMNEFLNRNYPNWKESNEFLFDNAI